MMSGLNSYDYGARQYYSVVPAWDRVDPLAEKYYSISPYAYCMGNPIRFIDKDGRSTYVIDNGNGTYRVVGGDINDKDRNIYVLSIRKGQLKKGKSIGVSATMTSFYDSDNKKWVKTTINKNDKSGYNFLEKFSIRYGFRPYNESFGPYYAYHARGNHKYDFKLTNGTENVTKLEGDSRQKYVYRGMPIGTAHLESEGATTQAAEEYGYFTEFWGILY